MHFMFENKKEREISINQKPRSLSENRMREKREFTVVRRA